MSTTSKNTSHKEERAARRLFLTPVPKHIPDEDRVQFFTVIIFVALGAIGLTAISVFFIMHRHFHDNLSIIQKFESEHQLFMNSKCQKTERNVTIEDVVQEIIDLVFDEGYRKSMESKMREIIDKELHGLKSGEMSQDILSSVSYEISRQILANVNPEISKLVKLMNSEISEKIVNDICQEFLKKKKGFLFSWNKNQ